MQLVVTSIPFCRDMAPLHDVISCRHFEIRRWPHLQGSRKSCILSYTPAQNLNDSPVFLFLPQYQLSSLRNRNVRGCILDVRDSNLGYLACWPMFLAFCLFLPVTYEKQYFQLNDFHTSGPSEASILLSGSQVF